jgi:hypothetical protein
MHILGLPVMLIWWWYYGNGDESAAQNLFRKKEGGKRRSFLKHSSNVVLVISEVHVMFTKSDCWSSWGPILSPWLWEETSYGVGMSFWPASPCSLAGRYDNPTPKLDSSPCKGLRIRILAYQKMLSSGPADLVEYALTCHMTKVNQSGGETEVILPQPTNKKR